MRIEPGLVETSAGVVGTITTWPSGVPKGALAILPGGGSTRAGLDQVWVKLAGQLAPLGVTSLRFDYPGSGESHSCRMSRWCQGTSEVLHWFRGQTGQDRLALVAMCAGLAPAYREVVRSPGSVLGVAMVMAPFYPYMEVPASPMSLYRQARRAAGSARRGANRLLARARFGPPDPSLNTILPKEAVAGLAHGEELLVEISKSVPLWALSTASDSAGAALAALHDRLSAGLAYQLELASSPPQDPGAFPGAEQVVAPVTRWAARLFGLREDEPEREEDALEREMEAS